MISIDMWHCLGNNASMLEVFGFILYPAGVSLAVSLFRRERVL